jgi:hypothetical protein
MKSVKIKSAAINLGISVIYNLYLGSVIVGSIGIIGIYSQACSKYCGENLSNLSYRYQQVIKADLKKFGL